MRLRKFVNLDPTRQLNNFVKYNEMLMAKLARSLIKISMNKWSI